MDASHDGPAYAARFGLVPIDDADAARMVALFDRAAAAGAAVPRQTDKELEPYHPRSVLHAKPKET